MREIEHIIHTCLDKIRSSKFASSLGLNDFHTINTFVQCGQ